MLFSARHFVLFPLNAIYWNWCEIEKQNTLHWTVGWENGYILII